MRAARLNFRSSDPRRWPRRGWLALAVAGAISAPTIAAARPPGAAFLGSYFGRERHGDGGYLRRAGPAPFRWQEPAAPVPFGPPPVVLYAPPPEATGAPSTPAPGAAVTSPNPADKDETKKTPSVRPEDFLPFFESTTGNPAPRGHGPDGLPFVPAQPALPTSSAEYKQK